MKVIFFLPAANSLNVFQVPEGGNDVSLKSGDCRMEKDFTGYNFESAPSHASVRSLNGNKWSDKLKTWGRVSPSAKVQMHLMDWAIDLGATRFEIVA